MNARRRTKTTEQEHVQQEAKQGALKDKNKTKQITPRTQNKERKNEENWDYETNDKSFIESKGIPSPEDIG